MRILAMLVAAFSAYGLGCWALWMPCGLWIVVWIALIAALVRLGRWLI